MTTSNHLLQHQRLLIAFLKSGLPDHMWGAVERYVLHGIPPGDFLRCVIRNDLRGAVAHADDRNSLVLAEWVRLFYNHVPSGAWGDEQNYRAWIERGGLVGTA